MKHIKNKKQFPKVGFNILLWICLLYASLGQALGQAPETVAKSSETAAESSETGGKPSKTAGPAELKEEKSEVTKPLPGSLEDFGILHSNNIFDPNRKPYRPDRKRQDPEPEPQIDAFTVIGLMAYANRQIAVLSGSSSEYSGVFKLNDQIDNLKLVSLSDKAVEFTEGEATFNVDIGTSLRRVDGGAWKESSEPVNAASKSRSSRSQYSSREGSRREENEDSEKDAEDKEDESDGATDSEAELIRKMMERRRQEVGE
ncbi:MAG: hypothetical protein QF732_03890 [Nitrospinaceae bacterium]|nr:hypothetical protein [Nitrospinaceae bacterium]